MTWAYDDHDFDHLGMFRNVHLSKNMPYAFMVFISEMKALMV